MLILTEKVDQRKLDIFTYIYNASEGLSLNQLSDKLAINNKTVKIYLAELADYLMQWDACIRIEEQNRKYQISHNSNFNIEQVYMALKAELPIFKLYHVIFLGKLKGIKQYSEEQFYSISKIYKQLKYLKKELKTYDLYFDQSNQGYVLHGDEQKIRFYTFHYYWEIFKEQKWPFDKKLKKELTFWIESFEENMKMTLSIREKEQLRLWLAIIKIRVDQDLLIYFDKNFIDELKKQSLNETEKQWMLDFFGHKLTSSEFFFLFLVLNLTVKRNNIQELLPYLSANNLLVGELCEEIKQELMYQSEFKEISSELFILEGIYYQRYLSLDFLKFNHTGGRLHGVVAEKFDFIVSKYPELVSDSKLLATYLGALFFDCVAIKNYLNPIKVQLMFGYGEIDEYPVRKKLFQTFPNLIYSKPIEKDYDCLITDFLTINQENSTVPVIYFNRHNSLEWDAVQEAILALSIPKK